MTHNHFWIENRITLLKKKFKPTSISFLVMAGQINRWLELHRPLKLDWTELVFQINTMHKQIVKKSGDMNQSPVKLKSVRVDAVKEIAYDSPDHLMPHGTRFCNTRHPYFIAKLSRIYRPQGPFWLLDLGCAGGGLVKDCFDIGCGAVGIEGSDYSKIIKRAEWRTIPEFLFTADITAPFQTYGTFPEGETPLKFDVVTAWEVVEHIHENGLPELVANVKRHLKPGGMWIMSVATTGDVINGVELHQTVKPKKWWIDKFRELGLYHAVAHQKYFNHQFLRGPRDIPWKPGFNLVLTNDLTKLPPIPKEPLLWRAYEWYHGCMLQQILKLIFYGLPS